jgi:myosin heavy subunit
VQHIFTYEIKELKEEGIRAPKVEYTTNDDQVELLTGFGGIFSLLDEQTKVPNSDDKSTIIKMHKELSSNPAYDNLRNSPLEFQIAHYAGKVKYQVTLHIHHRHHLFITGTTNSMHSQGKFCEVGRRFQPSHSLIPALAHIHR